MKILIFGTGGGLLDLLSVLPPNIEIVGLLDNNPAKQGTSVQGKPVYCPDRLSDLEYERIVISTREGTVIRDQLVELGVPRERILLYHSNYNGSLRKQVNREFESMNRELGLGLHPISLCTMPTWPIEGTQINPYEDDYCRMMAIQLAVQRTLARGIPGAIAELGVYRGEFAAVLNRLCPERTLYLFDTFEGFSDRDLSNGEEKDYSAASAGDFQDTTVDLVMSQMPHPEKVVLRKGYFPETAEGLEETFALVSLDVDLYKPIVAGLQYFYPRLSAGGNIFVHDYNNRRYNGVKSAVEEFVDATGASLVQLPDVAGTAVICK